MKHIHLIGICGTGMGSLAGLLTEAGFKVSGSDTQFYPPMGDQLRALPITLYQGFAAQNLKPRAGEKPDAVVIGNVCRSDNVEAAAAQQMGIPYYSLPQALNEFFLKNKKALVVAGTHGKTTTATLLAWVLTNAGFDPGFLIGGVGINLGKSFHLGRGDYFVVEGDEYDTAFFDKGPKFAHYRPAGAILTSVEWDHVDIFPAFDKMIAAFEKFIQTLSKECTLLAWTGSRQIADLTRNPVYKCLGYGQKSGEFTAENIAASPEGISFNLCAAAADNGGGEKIPLFVPLSGTANLENTIAVCGLCRELGLSREKIREGLKTFQGVKKRQEVKGIVKGVTVIDDFAHHPTAVQKTIEGLKERFPNQRLIVVFEPRSNTSRRNTHYREYCRAFNGADRVILAPPYHPENIPEKERLDTGRLADDLMQRGVDAYAIGNHESILEFIVRSIGPGEVVAFFSNGDFGNIHEKLLEKLQRRKILTDRKQVRSTKLKL